MPLEPADEYSKFHCGRFDEQANERSYPATAIHMPASRRPFRRMCTCALHDGAPDLCEKEHLPCFDETRTFPVVLLFFGGGKQGILQVFVDRIDQAGQTEQQNRDIGHEVEHQHQSDIF